MANDSNTDARVGLPNIPAPALTTEKTSRPVVNAQPEATTPMSLEGGRALRLRGGGQVVECIVGGINVETG